MSEIDGAGGGGDIFGKRAYQRRAAATRSLDALCSVPASCSGRAWPACVGQRTTPWRSHHGVHALGTNQIRNITDSVAHWGCVSHGCFAEIETSTQMSDKLNPLLVALKGPDAWANDQRTGDLILVRVSHRPIAGDALEPKYTMENLFRRVQKVEPSRVRVCQECAVCCRPSVVFLIGSERSRLQRSNRMEHSFWKPAHTSRSMKRALPRRVVCRKDVRRNHSNHLPDLNQVKGVCVPYDQRSQIFHYFRCRHLCTPRHEPRSINPEQEDVTYMATDPERPRAPECFRSLFSYSPSNPVHLFRLSFLLGSQPRFATRARSRFPCLNITSWRLITRLEICLGLVCDRVCFDPHA